MYLPIEHLQPCYSAVSTAIVLNTSQPERDS